jgi:hypothetical protein
MFKTIFVIALTFLSMNAMAVIMPSTVVQQTNNNMNKQPVVRVSPSKNIKNLPLYMTIPVQSVTYPHPSVEVATPLLTMCTSAQYYKAQLWQADCASLKDVKTSYCPLLSYFRYCQEATPDDVKGLQPIKEKYHNIFLKPD